MGVVPTFRKVCIITASGGINGRAARDPVFASEARV